MKLLAFAATVVAVFAAIWVLGSPVARTSADAAGIPGYITSLAGVGLAFLLAALAVVKLRRRRPGLGLPLGAGVGVAVVLVGGLFAWTHLVDDKANDNVSFADTARPASAPPQADGPTRSLLVSHGDFTGIDHDAKGRARIVITPDGERRLVFTQFDVERAPDLRVYLAVDPVDGDVGEHTELGRLKGNVGNQFYRLPKSLDLKRYDNVVIWCRAFDVGVAQAELRGA